MDSLTHIVVGACVGELIAGKQLGKKAMVIGAIANSLPDIDVLSSCWHSVAEDLLAHRGFTHSILFALLAGPILGWLCMKLFKKSNMAFGPWAIFWTSEILLHLLIDSMNTYGTGLFEPFSHMRVSFNTMYVADPLFTIWPIIGFVALIIMKAASNRRRLVAKTALILSGIYALAGICFKQVATNAAAKDMAAQHITPIRSFTTPTPLNNLLWYVVAQTDSGYYIGYRSVFDGNRTMNFHYTARNENLLKNYETDNDVKDLLRFSQGYYSIDRRHDTLAFNDIRFGEIDGWEDPHPRFVFYYFLRQRPAANDLIVQRGRFARWDKRVLASFLSRIGGN